MFSRSVVSVKMMMEYDILGMIAEEFNMKPDHTFIYVVIQMLTTIVLRKGHAKEIFLLNIYRHFMISMILGRQKKKKQFIFTIDSTEILKIKR